jgi:hypothetical protein
MAPRSLLSRALLYDRCSICIPEPSMLTSQTEELLNSGWFPQASPLSNDSAAILSFSSAYLQVDPVISKCLAFEHQVPGLMAVGGETLSRRRR